MPTSGRASSARASIGNDRSKRLTVQRLNAPQRALVEAHVDGSPRRVNRSPVALVREEWRVVDRWWTEEPVSRRYFDLVLAGRERAGGHPDEGRGRWCPRGGAWGRYSR